MAKNGFTKTQQALINLLSDGHPHTRSELHDLCGPSSLKNVRCHLSMIRKKLPRGEDIVCRIVNRRICYQHVRLIGSAYNGKR